MKLRFSVNQAEAFRLGIDCPNSIVTIEVDPSKLNERERGFIADRLHGIDVCKLLAREGSRVLRGDQEGRNGKPLLIAANGPELSHLIEAVLAEEAKFEERKKKAQGAPHAPHFRVRRETLP